MTDEIEELGRSLLSIDVDKLDQWLCKQLKNWTPEVEHEVKRLFFRHIIIYGTQVAFFRKDIRRDALPDPAIFVFHNPRLFSLVWEDEGIQKAWYEEGMGHTVMEEDLTWMINKILSQMDMISTALGLQPFRFKFNNGISIDSLQRIDEFWDSIQGNYARASEILNSQTVEMGNRLFPYV